MHFKPNIHERQTSIKVFPLKKTSSAISLAIHGDLSRNPHSDSLEIFTKDYATLEREQKQKKLNRRLASIEKIKNERIQRQELINQESISSLDKLLERQRRSQVLYQSGEKMSTYTTSLPINPLSCEYLGSRKGQELAKKDEQKNINRCVRAHYLQTIGNSGYNIVNGKLSVDLENYVPQSSQALFESKLAQLYSRYRLNPESS